RASRTSLSRRERRSGPGCLLVFSRGARGGTRARIQPARLVSPLFCRRVPVFEANARMYGRRYPWTTAPLAAPSGITNRPRQQSASVREASRHFRANGRANLGRLGQEVAVGD